MKKSFLVFFLFIIIVSFAVVRYKNIQVPALPNLSQKEETTTTTKEVTLEENNGEVLITYEQLNEMISANGGSIVSGVKTEKEEDHIKATGKAKVPLEADFVAKIILKTEQDRVISEITYLRVGKLESPAGVSKSINGFIQKSLDDKINGKYKVKSVKIGDKGIEVKLI